MQTGGSFCAGAFLQVGLRKIPAKGLRFHTEKTLVCCQKRLFGESKETQWQLRLLTPCLRIHEFGQTVFLLRIQGSGHQGWDQVRWGNFQL